MRLSMTAFNRSPPTRQSDQVLFMPFELRAICKTLVRCKGFGCARTASALDITASSNRQTHRPFQTKRHRATLVKRSSRLHSKCICCLIIRSIERIDFSHAAFLLNVLIICAKYDLCGLTGGIPASAMIKAGHRCSKR